jgi:hypothetical protein
MRSVSNRLAAALALSQEASKLTLRYFQSDQYVIERKSDQSPVTLADREAEQLLREQIARQFPDDAVIGEEYGEKPGSSGYTWVLDPIDGTKSFIAGVPLYSQLIGILDGRESIAGVISVQRWTNAYLPLGEKGHGGGGNRVHLDGRTCPSGSPWGRESLSHPKLTRLPGEVPTTLTGNWNGRRTSHVPGGTVTDTCSWQPVGPRRWWTR